MHNYNMRTNQQVSRLTLVSAVDHTTRTRHGAKHTRKGLQLRPLSGPRVVTLLLLTRGLSLKRVGHEASVGSLGDKGMPRSHNLKAQKAEGTEQGGSIITVLVEANEDVVNMELLFSKLKKNCEAVFAPLGQSAARDLDVEAAVAQHRSPVNMFGLCEPGLDIKNPRLVIRR